MEAVAVDPDERGGKAEKCWGRGGIFGRALVKKGQITYYTTYNTVFGGIAERESELLSDDI